MPKHKTAAKAVGASALAALLLTACGDSEEGGETLEAEPQNEITVDLDLGDVELNNEGTLQVCSDVPYPPFEYYDGEGDVVGFDIDIAEVIADALDADLEVVQTGFEGIQSGVALDAGTCDLAISGMTITEARAGNMLFSEPYLDDNLGLLAATEAEVSSLDDLEGLTVGVQTETTGADYAQEQGYEVREYSDSGLLIQGLDSGQVEAAIGNISILGYQAGESDTSEFIEEIDTGEQLGIAVATGNDQLITAVNEVLAELDASGGMEELEDRWFREGDTPEEGDADEEAADEEPAEDAATEDEGDE
ncbi:MULTISPECIES: ABC transporter substrate-binding protein [unclassified Nesterenkonia]|uniref:ABC transporter substrate-binding protein n=1 Tax=unclassified Nesterenkonia TaxID=2629769 RepID=UPI001F4CF0DA|nr:MULTISPECIES: ABC transporter substrate-binding protein [unclassified Nesterenkonia]MCH8560571.1 ABC transporter substrate-binding protein [Nesterenkonia sp. DZ6]MCH8562838.1 ABC transporter substrate-binding protein [Nesterenkonia sp. YGD6]MCH8570679.1 ABC transporter substrate-binding protein [Nesterenkonia sp. AY15]